MANITNSIPKGTRDFSPEQMLRRNYIFNTIRKVYHAHGFQQIETPAIETLKTLMGKYGEEGDKLLFKIINSGDCFNKVNEDDLSAKNTQKILPQISEKGLRYDLTVPFARYVVMHKNDLTMPFKRYQIQPVWRADRPQKGRYREFYQCDADVIGTTSLLNEVELIQIIDEVFTKLNINVKIIINNRKLLTGITEYINEPNKLIEIITIIDKLDKIGEDNVIKELQTIVNDNAIEKIKELFNVQGTNEEKLKALEKLFTSSEIGQKGIEETYKIFDYLKHLEIKNEVCFDLTLARGLNYYTGTIFEVKAKDVQIGSITGGGRYDNLTGIFGLEGLSGVGISFGADRIYDVLEQLNLFPTTNISSTHLLFLNFGENEMKLILPIAEQCRQNNINTEVYPEPAKIKKQMSYANAKNIKYVAIIGENEAVEHKVTLKNMENGEQMLIDLSQLIEKIK